MNRAFISLFVASMMFMASCGGGGGGTGGVVAPPGLARSAELNTEVSKLASGGLLVIDLEGIAPPNAPISALLDGTTEVALAPFGNGLVAGIPEVVDGAHTVTFTLSGRQYSIPFTSFTEALPENLPDYFDAFVDDLNQRLAGVFPTVTDQPGTDRISEYRAQLVDLADQFSTLSQTDQIAVVRSIQSVIIPSLQALNNLSEVRSKSGIGCDSAKATVAAGAVAALATILLVGGTSASVVTVGIGLIALAPSLVIIEKGIDDLSDKCFKVVTSTRVFGTPKAAIGGLEFAHGVPERFGLTAEGTYDDLVVDSIAALQSAARSLAKVIDAIASGLLGRTVDSARVLVEDILDYETTVEFEPDGSGYAIQGISDREITGQASGGVGFVTLRFNHARTLPVDGMGTPFTFSLVDTVDDTLPLEQVDITASLKGQPDIVGIGSVTVRKGGVVAGELMVPEGWRNLAIANQPENGGIVTLNDDATGVIFNGPTDFVGRDSALISATVDGQGVLGLVTLFTLDNCELPPVFGTTLREEVCFFDTSLTKRELFIRTIFDGFFGQGGGRQYLWTRYVAQSPINGVTILEDTVMRPLDDLTGASDNFEQTRLAQLDSAGVPISSQHFSGREGRFIAGQRLFTSTYSRSGDLESGSSSECNPDFKATSIIGGIGSIEENGSDDPENPRPPLPFAEFCGSGAVVDQINDLVPNPFPVAPPPG